MRCTYTCLPMRTTPTASAPRARGTKIATMRRRWHTIIARVALHWHRARHHCTGGGVAGRHAHICAGRLHHGCVAALHQTLHVRVVDQNNLVLEQLHILALHLHKSQPSDTSGNQEIQPSPASCNSTAA